MHPEIAIKATNTESPDRRSVLAGIGAATTAAIVSASSSPVSAQPAPVSETFWDQRYQTSKGDVRLQLYRRRLKAPVAGQAPLPVLILAHGSSMSAMPTFDLTVPGAGE